MRSPGFVSCYASVTGERERRPEESFFCRIFQNKPAIISNDIFRHTAHTMDAAQRRLKIKQMRNAALEGVNHEG